MDKQTESRSQFEKLCNEFWNWQEHDEITQGEEEPCLRWDGENYTHRVTAALWRMFNASRESLVVALPERQAIYASSYGDGYMVPSPSGEALEYDEAVEAIRAIGIRIKGEGV